MNFRAVMILILFPVLLHAAESGPIRKSTAFSVTPEHFTWFDANRIGSWISNRGELTSYRVTGSSGMEWPLNSRNSIDFASGLWVVGKVGNEVRATIAYYLTEFVPGTHSGAPENQSDPRFRNYVIDVSSGPGDPDYDEWPAADGAPTDSLGNPFLMGDKMAWSVFNDMDTSAHFAGFGKTPLGIEVRQTIWGYDRVGNFGDIMLFRWQIFNASPDTIDSAYIAIFDDADLGSASDDLTGVDTILNLGYTYNDSFDNIYGDAPPAIGYQFLSGAAVPSAGDTAYSFGKQIPDYKNLRMTAFPQITKSGGFPGREPQNISEVWFRMQGLLGDGTQSIDPSTGLPTLHVFSGDPVTGSGWLDPDIQDRRILPVSGPFVLVPGDSVEFTGAVVIARGENNLDSITELRKSARILEAAFNNGFVTPELTLIYPIGGETLFEVDSVLWSASAQGSDSIFVGIFLRTFKNEIIIVAERVENTGKYSWDTSLIPDGFYDLFIEAYHINSLPAEARSDSAILIDNIGNGSPSIKFTSDPAPFAASKIELNWVAVDPDGDTLFMSILHESPYGGSWTVAVDDIPNTGTYIWDTYDLPNMSGLRLRLLSSDGEFSDSTEVKYTNIQNKRLAILDSVFTNRIGMGNIFNVHIIDSSALTGHDYLTIFGDTRLNYTIQDLQTSEIVIEDGTVGGRVKESRLFDGLRLSIGFYNEPQLKDANWTNVSSDTSEYQLIFEHQSARGPSNYEVRFSNTENDTTINNPIILPFQVWNVTNIPATKVQLFYSGSNNEWSSWDLFILTEEIDGGNVLTWSLGFQWDSAAVAPQDGDLLFIESLWPHAPFDELVFNTYGAPIGIEPDDIRIPLGFELFQNYPNPFNPVTKIEYSITVRSEVSLIIYNLLGQEVARLIDGEQTAGVHSVSWDAARLSSGIYFYKLKTSGFVQTKKMVLLK